jgi:hypothetical protein
VKEEIEKENPKGVLASALHTYIRRVRFQIHPPTSLASSKAFNAMKKMWK